MVVGADLEFNVANMFVMTRLEAGQGSMAGGIFQTLTRLAMTVGLGILTAVYDGVGGEGGGSGSGNMGSGEALKPYTAVFWAACGLSATSVCLVPFLRIGTQGGEVVERERETASPTPVSLGVDAEDLREEKGEPEKGAVI